MVLVFGQINDVHCLSKRSNTDPLQSLCVDIPIRFPDGRTHAERDVSFHSTQSACDCGTVRTVNATVRGDIRGTTEYRESAVDGDLPDYG